MCSSNLDYRRFRFTLATFCSSQYLKELFVSCFSLARFKSESECKDKTFFRYPPNLFRSFFKLFFSRPRLKGPAGKDRRQHRQNAATA